MKFTFTGCSMTVGKGLEFKKDSPDNYTNIVSNHFDSTVTNLAVEGNSNYNIFMSALNEITFNDPDILFVQWSGLNRLWVYPGPDTELIMSNVAHAEYKYRDIHFSKLELQNFIDIWHMLNHDYKNILDIINYCNILAKVGQQKTRVVFINGLLPWTKELAELTTVCNFAENLSAYTRELLDFETRSDDELLATFKHLYNEISKLDKTLWVNQFSSMLDLRVDFGDDNLHPGVKSHSEYATMIINYLDKTI